MTQGAYGCRINLLVKARLEARFRRSGFERLGPREESTSWIRIPPPLTPTAKPAFSSSSSTEKSEIS